MFPDRNSRARWRTQPNGSIISGPEDIQPVKSQRFIMWCRHQMVNKPVAVWRPLRKSLSRCTVCMYNMSFLHSWGGEKTIWFRFGIILYNSFVNYPSLLISIAVDSAILFIMVYIWYGTYLINCKLELSFLSFHALCTYVPVPVFSPSKYSICA